MHCIIFKCIYTICCQSTHWKTGIMNTYQEYNLQTSFESNAIPSHSLDLGQCDSWTSYRMKLRLPVSFKLEVVLIYAKLANCLCCIVFPNDNPKGLHKKCYFEKKASNSDTGNRHLWNCTPGSPGVTFYVRNCNFQG